MAKLSYWINSAEKKVRVANARGDEIELSQAELAAAIETLPAILQQIGTHAPKAKKSMSATQRAKKRG